MELRKELINTCRRLIEKGSERIRSSVKDIEDAVKLETKGSMGDKYETGRAMLHLELEKLSMQMHQYDRMKETLGRIPGNPGIEQISFGSIVYTERGNFFLSVPAGEITVAGEKFYAVGINSPIARELSGRKIGRV